MIISIAQDTATIKQREVIDYIVFYKKLFVIVFRIARPKTQNFFQWSIKLTNHLSWTYTFLLVHKSSCG